MRGKNVAVILHDVRSVHNVGSIFRTADCAGVSKIYLCGYTPAPVDRFGRLRKDFTKVSLGAEKSVVWKSIASTIKLIDALKARGYWIIAVEQADNSVDYKKVRPKYPVALVLGKEVGGVPKEILKKFDVVAEILMKGKKESLNISVSVGISLFRMLGC
jgi:23S rRNA (guanosine2251-2'-O)-methyltransferase